MHSAGCEPAAAGRKRHDYSGGMSSAWRDNGDKYVLASPRLGPIANVPVDTCNATVDERALDLKDTDDHGINQSMLGHWIEVSGRLEKETERRPDQSS